MVSIKVIDMNKEIERKFLVKDGSFMNDVSEASHILQGYIASSKDMQVRVRMEGGKGTLSIKREDESDLISRNEWEYEIPLIEAKELLAYRTGRLIEKDRYVAYIGKDRKRWEINRYLGKYDNLVIAEVELEYENQYFERPSWLGDEVTNEMEYYNAELADMDF